MISWHYVTSAEYAEGVKVDGDLYFLKDTHEIYRGTETFSEAVVMYTTLPATGIAKNRLYIDSTTLEGKVHDGNGWKTVIRPITDTVTAEGLDPVSAKAVATYVAAEMAKINAASDIVSTLSWDSAEHILTAVAKDGQTKQEVVFNGLGVSLSYESTTGALQMLDAAGEKIGDPINLPLEQFVYSGEYNPDTKKIVLYFDAEKTNSVEIDAAALVDVYTGVDGETVAVSVSADNKISATVKVSAEAGNTVVLKSDGIYVSAPDLSGYMEKPVDFVEGNIAIFDSEGNASDSGKKFSDLAPQPTVFQGATIEEAVGDATPKKGDFCVVSVPIGSTDKVQKTAYFYDGVNWVAFDGNYSAENVYFGEDLVTTSAIGNITLTNGQATIAAAGKNLKQVFDTIFVKEKNPVTTQPSVSVSAPQNKAYEVGTTVTPSYTATLSTGNYTYGPATGITATAWEVTDTAGHSATTNSGSFDALVVEDSTQYAITATATYGDGAMPVTNTGNNYATGQIKAGSKSGTSAKITGYRCGFYGTLTSKDGAIDSALVRSLTGKTTAAPKAGDSWNMSIPVGAMRLVFAYPASIRDVNSVLDVNGMGAEVKTAFTKYDVTVEGANGYTGIAYKVYVADLAAANDTANTYTVKL